MTLFVAEGLHPTAMAALQGMGITVVPEPGTLALLALPLVRLLGRRGRRKIS
jgi:hypothetical protein